jgi:multidrug resistance efflux pump
MEIIITIAYFFLVRLVFFDYKWLRFNMFWKMAVFGVYFGAVLAEIIFLGQYTPYSKETLVNRFVVQIATERGGEIVAVHVTPNTPVKKGDVLIEMDDWRDRNDVHQLEAELVQAQQDVVALKAGVDVARARVQVAQDDLAEAKAAYDASVAGLAQAKAGEVFAKQKYEIEEKNFKQGAGSKLRAENARRAWDTARAALKGAIADQTRAEVAARSEAGVREANARLVEAEARYDSVVDGVHTQVAQIQAQLDSARVKLENRTIRAPSDGYVTNLNVKPGQVVRLKAPFMTFVSTDAYRIASTHIQKGIQWVQSGDAGEVAFDMYPGKVFPAEVVSVVWITPESQGRISGVWEGVKLTEEARFTVVMRLTGEHPEHPLRFGARGLAAIYTSKSVDALRVIRKIEMRSESYLNYLFNPF